MSERQSLTYPTCQSTDGEGSYMALATYVDPEVTRAHLKWKLLRSPPDLATTMLKACRRPRPACRIATYRCSTLILMRATVIPRMSGGANQPRPMRKREPEIGSACRPAMLPQDGSLHARTLARWCRYGTAPRFSEAQIGLGSVCPAFRALSMLQWFLPVPSRTRIGSQDQGLGIQDKGEGARRRETLCTPLDCRAVPTPSA